MRSADNVYGLSAVRAVFVSTASALPKLTYFKITAGGVAHRVDISKQLGYIPLWPFLRAPSTPFYRTTMQESRLITTGEKLDDYREFNKKHAARPLRYRTRALWLLGFYFLFIFIPWVLTCVLAQRPITSSSYRRQQGFLNRDISHIRNWKRTVDVLNSITGLITSKQHRYKTISAAHTNPAPRHLVPVLSALLARSAVLYC
jgi:hypothetical protein